MPTQGLKKGTEPRRKYHNQKLQQEKICTWITKKGRKKSGAWNINYKTEKETQEIIKTINYKNR